MTEQTPKMIKGFTTVDTQPDPSMMVAAMDATGQWAAVRQLRAWERRQLALKPGERLIDLGCGAGDVSIELAAAVAPGGAVVGIDPSAAMLDVARQRGAGAGVEVEFREGSALALDEPDESFDAARAERSLQWISDVEAAVGEMTRVLRPGGRLSLIDSDWRTFTIDLPDIALANSILRAHHDLRGPSTTIGGRLLNLCKDAGLDQIEDTYATHVWTKWDPDTQPAPPGLFPVRPMVAQLVAAGALEADTAERFLEQVVDAARRDRLYMALTMVAVAGTRPGG